MVSINWPQAVIRVQYTDMQVQESVTIEEAKEEILRALHRAD